MHLINFLCRRSKVPFEGLTESIDLNHIYAKIQETEDIELRRENRWRDMPVEGAKNLKVFDEDEGKLVLFQLFSHCRIEYSFNVLF